MSIEYITKEHYNDIPKGTIFIPVNQTKEGFKFFMETPENLIFVSVPKNICQIYFGDDIDPNNMEDMKLLEESRTQGLENED